MSETRQRYDDEFKKDAVKLSYANSKTVKEIAGDLGISVSMRISPLSSLKPQLSSSHQKITK